MIKKPNLDPEVLGNYRPVSNLPYLSKILERAVADQLQAHLDTNGLHVKFQSAYRRGHSTETALLRILNDLLVMIDGGNNAILVLLDLSAAFDTLDHTLLLQRLHAEIGLDGSALDWFSSYLSCRSQQVLVGHALSAETPLLCGVLQGSVLGPLLFSLYTRQLADLIDKFCIDYHFFADNSELYSCLPTEPESALSALRNVESCCRQIKIWMTKNKLKLNEQKTEVLLCGPSSRRETPCWLPFSWQNVYSVLQRGENTWSNWTRSFPWNNMSQPLSDLVFSTSDLWVKSVHTSPTKLQAALLSVWFCQSLTTANVQ